MNPPVATLYQPISLSDALSAARETRLLEIGPGALKRVPDVFRRVFGERPAVVVADAKTYAVAGKAVHEAFRSSHLCALEPFVFRSPGLYAEHRFVLELETELRPHDAIPVAVGSGTINDLTKLASHRTGRPYMCVGTAASMDGYTAFGASITHEGAKQTFQCPAPTAVVADLEILGSAPREMNAWGYADLLAKVTAGADWIVADALGVERIAPTPWNIVQGRLREAVADPAGVRAGRLTAIERLVEGLMLGGFAMQSLRSSRPASGAEHQFSHLWDMEHHTHCGRAPSHGAKVGIGTLAVTALYESLLRKPLDALGNHTLGVAWTDETTWQQRAHDCFGEGELGAVAAKEIAAKQQAMGGLFPQRLEGLRGVWPLLQDTLRQQLIPLNALRGMLREAGAPTAPEEIGISRRRLRESYWRAFFIRRRFTVLDLAVRTGLIDECLDDVFGRGGVWPIDG